MVLGIMVVKLDKVPFEDALTMTGFGKFNLFAFMICSIIITGMASEIFSVSYLVPGSACELSTTSAQQGMMAGVPLVGIIMTSHVWGYLADTRGRRKTLVVSMLVAFVSGSLAAFSPNWIVLSMFKFCSSAGVSGAFALSMTLLSEYTPMKQRSTLIMLTTSVFLVATGIMSMVALPILNLKFSYYIPYLDIHFNSWRLLDLIFAMPAALAALGVSLSYESPKYLLSVGQNEKALKVLQGISAYNNGKDKYKVNSVVLDEEGSSSIKIGFWASVKAQSLPMIKFPLLKDTLLLGSVCIVNYICINPFVVWSPFIWNAFMMSVEGDSTDLTICKMIRETTNTTKTVVETDNSCTLNETAMFLVFGINLLLSVLNLLTSSIVNCIGRKALFIGLQALSGIAALVINSSTSWPVSAMFLIIYNTGIINFGTLSSLIVDVFPTHVKAMAICITVMMGRGSAVFGINWLKNLLDNNCEAGFYIFGSISLVGAAIGLLLPSEATLKERKEKQKKEFANK